MEKLEKVMKGLECCSGGADREPNWNNLTARNCGKCPYNRPRIACTRALAYDALELLELLKAHQPHVMTLTEALDAEVVWLERYANPDDGVEPIIQPVIIRYYENGYWQCLIEQDEGADLSLFLDGFGTEFRFWTSRPTDKQWRATTWIA